MLALLSLLAGYCSAIPAMQLCDVTCGERKHQTWEVQACRPTQVGSWNSHIRVSFVCSPLWQDKIPPSGEACPTCLLLRACPGTVRALGDILLTCSSFFQGSLRRLMPHYTAFQCFSKSRMPTWSDSAGLAQKLPGICSDSQARRTLQQHRRSGWH